MKPVSKGAVKHGSMMITHWTPTILDRVKILFGQPIRLCIMGDVQPAVALDTKKTVAE